MTYFLYLNIFKTQLSNQIFKYGKQNYAMQYLDYNKNFNIGKNNYLNGRKFVKRKNIEMKISV